MATLDDTAHPHSLDHAPSNTSLSDAYVWPALVVIVLPILCGCLFITWTFFTARHDVGVWRGEFQGAFDRQCPDTGINIMGGEGTVYLDAYRAQYEWVGPGIARCYGDGRSINCTCPRE